MACMRAPEAFVPEQTYEAGDHQVLCIYGSYRSSVSDYDSVRPDLGNDMSSNGIEW